MTDKPYRLYVTLFLIVAAVFVLNALPASILVIDDDTKALSSIAHSIALPAASFGLAGLLSLVFLGMVLRHAALRFVLLLVTRPIARGPPARQR